MRIRDLQRAIVWDHFGYSAEFQASAMAHKDLEHAALHLAKAAGGVCAVVEEMDHAQPAIALEGDTPAAATARTEEPPGLLGERQRREAAKYLADLVICAVRAARVFPGQEIDLQTAVEARAVEKKMVPPAAIPDGTASERLDRLAEFWQLDWNPESRAAELAKLVGSDAEQMLSLALGRIAELEERADSAGEALRGEDN